MSIRKIKLLDAYNDEIIEKFSSFKLKNNIDDLKLESFISKAKKLSKEEYLEQRKKSNEIEEILFVEEDSKIKDYCHIYAEKDRKMCTVSFPKIDIKRKTIIPLVVSYTQNDLGLKETFIRANIDDKTIIKDLESLKYESLGEDSGSIIYLKEQELEKANQRMI